MYRLAIKKSARKELDSLPDWVFLKVDKSILALKEDPFPYRQKDSKVKISAGSGLGITGLFILSMKTKKQLLFIA